jgi:succinyl-diaminopimelate desuccinylase
MARYLLEQLVKIPSVTGQEARLAAFCEDYLQSCGFRTHRQYVTATRFNIVAEKGSGKWSLLLYSHLDTVAPSPGWVHSPYQMVQDGDYLYGLGISDMKAGMAVMLKAATQVQPEGYRLRIALGIDEEGFSRGAHRLLQSPWCDDVAGILVPELSIDSNTETLGLGRRGHFTYEITLFGRKVHAAVQHLGLNAIELASQMVLRLKHFPTHNNALWQQEDLLVRALHAHEPDLSVPDSCTLVLSYFAHPDRTQEEIQHELRQYIEGFTRLYDIGFGLRPTPSPRGYWTQPAHPFVRWIQQTAKDTLGQTLPETFGVSVADENVLATLPHSPPVLSLAPVGGNSHQPQEWVSQSSLERTLALYKQILARAGQIV